jgi:LysR family nitrogen assimilation transcriptional regulator
MNAVTYPMRADPALLRSEARERALGLRELRSFLSVASTGNLGRAARHLNVSQPAVSMQLRKLEEGFGTQLVWRHGHGVTLTPAGACLRDRLQTVMQLLASPLDECPADTPASRVSLAIPGELGPSLVTPLVKAFREKWSGLALDVREGNGADVEEWILHRHVDLAILQDPPSLSELESAPLFTEPLGLIVPTGSALVEQAAPLSIRAIADGSLILPGQPHWVRRRLDTVAQQYGVLLNPILQAPSFALIKAMVRGGLGYTVLPRASVQDEIDKGALAFRPIGHPPLFCTRVLAFHRALSNSLVPAVAGMVCDLVVALVARGAWAGAQPVATASRDTALARLSEAPSPNALQSREEVPAA